MPLYFTISDYIKFGKATEFLMANYQASGVLWGPTLVQPSSPVLVNIVTDALRWQFDGQPNDETLEGVAQYLLFLCGKFQLQARNLPGGGSVTPTPPVTPMPNNLDFYVDASTTPLIAGQSSATFPQFIGYNIVFNRNGIAQAQANDGVNSYFSWNKITGLFQCFGAAQLTELFSINPV